MINTDKINEDIAHLSNVLAKFDNNNDSINIQDRERLMLFIRAYLVILQCKERRDEGIIKGSWFYLDDGTKKSINSNGFEILKYLD